MRASTTSLLFTTFLVVCEGSFLSFDVRVAEMSGDEEVKSEESEIFLDDHFLTPTPPSIVLDYNDEEEDTLKSDEYLGRATFNLTDLDASFGKEERHVDEHMNFELGFGGIVTSPTWSEWTCCRPAVNLQSRERVVRIPRIEMEYKHCHSNFCPAHECKDNLNVCEHFISSMGSALCDKSHTMLSFMSHHCPGTCNFCGAAPQEPTVPSWQTKPWRPRTTRPTRPPVFTRPATTRRPWWMTQRPTTTRAPYVFTTTKRQPTTAAPWWTRAPAQPSGVSSNMVKVNILKHNIHQPYPSYKFTAENPDRAHNPWRKIPSRGSELSHLYLYRTPTDVFTTSIRFCSSTDNYGYEKWSVSKRRCGRGWTEKLRLYGSLRHTSNSQLYYVGNRGKPLWSSRVSKDFPSSGYTSSIFYFYGPKANENKPTYPTRPYPSRPVTTRRPYTTRRTPRPYPTQPYPTTTRRTYPTRPVATRRPTGFGQQPTDSYNKECLEAHNFFRAVHNVPPLQWSPELARTSQSWADQLKMIAPERPNRLVMPGRRTRNWPHSDSGRGHRNRGDGENIAWDLSGDGSPAKESVLRWYSEIFYYNRKHPTYSPGPNKPVGHLTQMLWKDTTHLGCGVATTTLPRFRQVSTWSVSHYSPGGNIRYGNSASMTKKLYDEQVPDIRDGSCITKSGACNNGNQCMAFGPARGSCTCTNNEASCRSNRGCIVWCENKRRTWPWKEECQGNYECKCTRTKGAVCN